MLLHLHIAEGTQIHIQQHILLHVTVDAEDADAALVVHGRRGVHHRHALVIHAVVLRRVHQRAQRRSAAVLGHVQERPVDGLRPSAAAVAGHDGRNHVDQLRQAGDLHAIRVAQERNQDASRQQRVLEVVYVLQNRQRASPAVALPDLLILLIGVVPHVPLVKGQVDGLFRMLLSLDRVADADHGADKVLQIHGAGQESGRIVSGIAVIAVQGHVIHRVVALLQHLQLPVAERLHLRGGGTAGHQLDGRIHPFHDLAGLVRQSPVFGGRLVAHLPRAVHLVAQAPQLDAEWIALAVSPAQIAPIGSARMVGILHHVARRVHAAGTQVDGVHRAGVGLFAPVGKLVQTHLVGLGGKPGQIQPLRTMILRAD